MDSKLGYGYKIAYVCKIRIWMQNEDMDLKLEYGCKISAGAHGGLCSCVCACATLCLAPHLFPFSFTCLFIININQMPKKASLISQIYLPPSKVSPAMFDVTD